MIEFLYSGEWRAALRPNRCMMLSMSTTRSFTAVVLALVAVVSCGRSNRATSALRPGDTTASPERIDSSTPPESEHEGATPSDAARARVYPPEATDCQAAADCVRVSLRADVELNGGPCCAVCAGYVALNRAYHARQPVCDEASRGACGFSCPEGRPPPVTCEAGNCVLTYPPVRTTCQSDSECVTVPRLLPNAPPSGCRIACGQYIAGNREWDAWAAGLWQNTSVTGACPPNCVDRLLPAAACAAGQCQIRAQSVVGVVRVDLRTPTVTGSLSAAEIVSVVTSGQGQFTSCQERPRSLNPIGYAGFQMQFVVGADGRVGDIDAGEIANHLPDVAECMTRVIRGLQFPLQTSGGTTRVEYPMGAAFETR